MSESRHLGEKPSRVPPADLGSAFGAVPDRTAGLRELGLSQPMPAPTPPTREPEPMALVESAQPVTQRRPPSRQSSQTSGGGSRPVVVYLPASLQERLRMYSKQQQERPYTDIVLDAIDETHQRLAQLMAPARGGRSPGSLFKGREMRRRRHDEPQVQVSLRPSRSDLAVIDRLVREHRAGSRSALVATALDAYLPPLREADPT